MLSTVGDSIASTFVAIIDRENLNVRPPPYYIFQLTSKATRTKITKTTLETAECPRFKLLDTKATTQTAAWLNFVFKSATLPTSVSQNSITKVVRKSEKKLQYCIYLICIEIPGDCTSASQLSMRIDPDYSIGRFSAKMKEKKLLLCKPR